MTEYQKLLAYLKIAYNNLTTMHRNLVHDDGWFGNHEQLGDWYNQISDQLDDLTETGIALGMAHENVVAVFHAILLSVPGRSVWCVQSY